MKKYCVILASGTGSRFEDGRPKQFIEIDGLMIVEHTLHACDCGVFDELILVVPAEYRESIQRRVENGGYAVPVRLEVGGGSRMASCESGVAAIDDAEAMVCVHNGVQPFVPKSTFVQCLDALADFPVATSGVPCVFTVLETDDDGKLVRMPSRSRCYSDLGPECFRLSMLRTVLEIGKHDDGLTNLTGVVLKHGLGEIQVVPGDPHNLKITYPEDMIVAEKLLHRNRGGC